MAVLLLAKIAMVVASGHQLLVLKGIGCISVSIGMLFMILGVLNAKSTDPTEFSAAAASFATIPIDDHPIG